MTIAFSIKRDVSFGPAVKDGELLYTSPSALAKFDPEVEGGCPTRWWLRYVQGEKEPQTADQTDGVEGHSQLEFYARTGDDVLGPIARAGKHLVHPPGADALVEVPLKTLTADGLKVVGFVDRINLSGRYVNPDGGLIAEPRTPEVIDYKFTKDLKYAKQGLELLTTQMTAYAEEIRLQNPSVAGIRLSHVYFQKRKRGALKSTKVFSSGQIESNWRIRGDAVVRQMRGVVGLAFEKVPKQLSSCSTFGGCPFRKTCFKSPLAQFRAMKGIDMGLLEKLRGQQGNGTSAPPPVQAATPLPQAPPPAAKSEFVGTIDIAKCEIGVKYLLDVKGTVGEYTGSSKQWGFFQVDSDASAARLSLDSKVNPIPPAEVKETKPKTRKMKIEDAAVAPEKGIRLFINCIPSGSYEQLDNYVNEAAKELSAQYKMDDVRFATDSDHPLAFGRWKGALASLVRAKLPVDGSYVAFTMGSELVQCVAEAILPYAAMIVRGVR